MTTYSREEIATAMLRAGFPASEVRTGVGVALAESNGRTEATGTIAPGEYSAGVWQINLPAHPGVTERCARDLICSTQYAYRLWAERGWAPWSAFLNGTYQRFVGAAEAVGAGVREATASASGAIDVSGFRPRFTFPEIGLGKGTLLDPEVWREAGWSVAASVVALIVLGAGLLALVRGARRTVT